MATQDDAGDLVLVDELAAEAGLTVRTTRYYASLGLIPPPIRRGRVAYYGPVHRTRLRMIRALQEHGFTLQAIERYNASLPADATLEDLALQKAMLTSWAPQPRVELTRKELDRRAGRRLTDDEVDKLVQLGILERSGRSVVAVADLALGLGLLDVDVPFDAVGAAAAAIERHMTALAEELDEVLRSDVLGPLRRSGHSAEDAERFEHTMSRLRQLTLEAVVTGFQRAVNDVIVRSLSRD